MNQTFQVIGLFWSCLVSLILTPVALTKWLTQISVDCNRFNKGEINEVRIEWTLKRIQRKREPNGLRQLYTASIHTNMTKHQNKV